MISVSARRPTEAESITRMVVWPAIVAVLAVRLLFLLTFPLNDFGGDTSNYAWMLLHGTSSLVHAGGYPFLIGLPFRTAVVQHLTSLVPGSLPYAILIMQHGIDLLVLWFMYRVVSRIFGRATAAVAVLLAGANLQSLAATSSTYPEWLQAALLVLSFGLVYYARIEDRFGSKLSIYALAALAFTGCILVKFNAAVLGFVFLFAILFERVSLTRKAVTAVVCCVVAAVACGAYIVFHHAPSTGTYALTYDKAWVLLTKTQAVFDNQLDPDNGLNTRRWLALNAVLPPMYHLAGPGLYSHVDAISPKIRAGYRARYAYLLTADDTELAGVLQSAKLPDGFSVGVSPITVAYHIGLRESDELGVKVATEAFRAHPAQYLDAVAAGTMAALTRWPSDAPFPAAATSLRDAGVVVYRPLGLGYVRVDQRPDYWNVGFSYSVPVVWWPGVRIFTAVNSIAPGGSMLVALAGIAVLFALFETLRGRFDVRVATILLLATVVFVCVVVSSATLWFRWKEARLILPFVSVLAASAIVLSISVTTAWLRRWRAPVASMHPEAY